MKIVSPSGAKTWFSIVYKSYVFWGEGQSDLLSIIKVLLPKLRIPLQ